MSPSITTDMRETKEIARRIHFEATATVPTYDVQTAIEMAAAIGSNAGATPGYTPTIVTAAMSPYAPTINDTILFVDTSVGPVTIQMPLSAARLTTKGYVPLIVKDDSENADVNNINVLRAGAELIDGLTTYQIDSKSTAVTFMPNPAGGYDVI